MHSAPVTLLTVTCYVAFGILWPIMATLLPASDFRPIASAYLALALALAWTFVLSWVLTRARPKETGDT